MSDILVSNNGDGFDVVEPTTSRIVGKLLKFNTAGEFIVDKVEKLPPNVRLVATSMTTCWVKWQDKKPIDTRITRAGQSHPYRDMLGDDDKELWEAGLNGQPSDPWRDTRYVHLVDPATGQEYTFTTDSVGGRKGVGELKSQIANVRTAHPRALPVVACVEGTFETKFGPKPYPRFDVVDWKGKPKPVNGGSGKPSADMDDDIPF
jgi:hypothetical protein